MKTNSSKLKITRFISLGAATGVTALCLAFTPIRQAVDKWVAPPSSASVKNPVPSNVASIAEGKKIYEKNCKSCHGTKGKGDGPKADKLDKTPDDFTKPDFQKQTDGEVFWKTTNGKKPMPSYKKDLTDEERWQVINYLRTLK